LQITAWTETGQELVRTWRTDAVLGGLSAARMTDRVRWQLEGWLTGNGGGRRGGGGRGAPGAGTGLDPAPAALVRLGLRAEDVVPVGAEQGRLWGGVSGADLRAQRALHRVQGLIGADAVLGVAVQGGRDLRDQVHLVPWGTDTPPGRPTAPPWPGGLPAPAPATVLVEPEVVQVCAADGRPVEVTARLELSAEPVSVRWAGDDGPELRLDGWAGPWPVVQRWWTGTPRRQVYLQATLTGGRAVLLCLAAGVWTVEAHYD
jgi:protein ImuB